MRLYTRMGNASGADGLSEEEREDEGTSRLRILVPKGTQEVHEGGSRNPRVPRLAERFRASTNPSRDLGFHEPFAIDSPGILLHLLPRDHNFQAEPAENELGQLESRPVTRVPEWMLGNNGQRVAAAISPGGNAPSSMRQTRSTRRSRYPGRRVRGGLPGRATRRGITDARTNGACTPLSIPNRLS